MIEIRIKRAAFVTTLAAVLFLSLCVPGDAADVWRPLVDRLAQDGFERSYVETIYSDNSLEFAPEVMARKMNVLLDTKLQAKKPGPAPKPKVLKRYLNPLLIAGAYGFFREHRSDFIVIEKKYGVPGEVLTALMLVETKLGTQIGSHSAIKILSSMALAGDFDHIRPLIKRKDISDDMMKWLIKRTTQKGNWAYTELKSLLTYAQKNGQDPLVIPSSVYGAIGLCQFIPSSAIHYGVDGSGDGQVNLFNVQDALHSIAHFLNRHGWKAGLSREAELKVLYRYNHSQSYALTIMSVADKIKSTNDFFGNS